MGEGMFWVGLGALGGVALLAMLRLVAPSRLDIGVFGTTCSIYAVYVGLALGGPLPTVILEALIAVAAPLIVLALWRHRIVLMPAFLLFHAGLDLAHELLSVGFPPLWYVQACLSLDVVFAIGAYVLMRRASKNQGNLP
ncbi:MAG: hypothetical protein RKE49_09450 [Oceanicaulis sp.]